MRIYICEVIKLRPAIIIHAMLVVVQSAYNNGKVEMDDEITIMFGSWILTNIELAKNFIKLVFLVDVIVIFKHGDGKALAESARPYKEEVHIRVFYFLDERSLIYIVAIPFNHILKILHTIRYSLAIDSLFSFSYHSSLLFAMTEYKVTKYS